MITPELQPQSTVDLDLMQDIFHAQSVHARPDSPVLPTEIFYDEVLSERYAADIWFASELHQPIGAYKIRGVDYFMQSLSGEEQKLEKVTASAGNHAQAVALLAHNPYIFMPENTPSNKVRGVMKHGGEKTRVALIGETYDECQAAALEYCGTTGAVFIPPFNSRRVIAGQGTLGQEIADELPDLDTVFCPVGGGGLLAGIATALKYHNPDTEIIGVEPAGAASMQAAIHNGQPTPLRNIDTFVDGAAVRQVGDIPFAIARPLLSRLLAVSNQSLRGVTTDLRERGLPVELAAALAPAGVEQVAPTLIGKKVLYILTGGNLSQQRYENEVRLMT